MGGILGITGTPGTGKKTIAPVVARYLHTSCSSLDDIARGHRLLRRGGEVDTREMQRWVPRDVTPPALVYGHLLPYVVPPGVLDRVVVLRCEPNVLKRRLVRRGYPPGKVAENVEAELIGVVSADAYDRCGPAKTSEVDTSISPPKETALDVAELLRGPRNPPPRIDWTLGYDSAEKLSSLLSGGG